MSTREADVRQQFKIAMRKQGLVPPDNLIADGRIHRCAVDGKSHGNKSGAYLLHLTGSVPAGGFINWTDGRAWQNWHYPNIGRELSSGENEELALWYEEAKKQLWHAERRQRARAQAKRMWEEGPDADPKHPYLVRKKIKPYGLRMHEPDHLLVPMYDERGKFHNLQLIDPDGGKRFRKNARAKNMHYWVAPPKRAERGDTIVLCEGYATGASIQEATGYAVCMAFDAANLPSVAEWIRERHPDKRIIIAADDDWATEREGKGNPGVTKAKEAARAVKAALAIPVFGDDRSEQDTDFNDLAIAKGVGVVKRVIDDACEPEPLAEDEGSEDEKEKSASTEETVQRIIELAKLGALEYEQSRTKAAKELHVRASALDKLVAEQRMEFEADAVLEPFWTVEPWPEKVDTAALLDSLTQVIGRYVATLGDREIVPALWVMFTWVHEAATHSPILLVTSAAADSGKTTLAGLLTLLVRRGLGTVEISGAALFRSVEKWTPTFVIDEADTVLVNNEDLRAVVNSGWTRGLGVIRCDPETHEPRKYSTFAPKALTMKGRRLPDTTLSRTIIIELKRKAANERVADFNHVDDVELAELRAKLARWAMDNAEALREAQPEMVPGFHNRLRMNWYPLLAIAELAGSECATKARAAAQAIEGSGPVEDMALGIRLLADIKEIFEAESEGDGILSRVLVGHLTDDPEKPWAEYRHDKPLTQRQLAGLLGQFGITSETVHPDDDNHGKGYRRVRFEEAWARYLPGKPPFYPCKRANADASAVSGTFPIRAKKDFARIENDEKSLSHSRLHACTDRNAKNEPTRTRWRDQRPGFEYHDGTHRERIRNSAWWKQRQRREAGGGK
jgi:putative DNA primase/helicase